MIARIAMALALVGATPAAAQTAEEALRTNTAVALNLCISSFPSIEANLAAFRTAGFSETVERSSGNSDTTHTFTGPNGMVVAELYYGEMAPDCRVRTQMGVTAASEVLDWIVPQVRPGYAREVTLGAPDPATGRPAECVRYVEQGRAIPFVIGVGADTQSVECAETGASVLFSFSAV